mmetsp:Transcript_13567/g.20027  ORF Transcript_13567/g.20027 Transcript_13567/m.20027 type:complete len:409 (+) Transcript_13567:47-1273(+)
MAAPPLPVGMISHPPPPVGMPPQPGMPPPLSQQVGMPPAARPSSLPPSNVVLLADVPGFLHPQLANWILPCGPARTILWYPKQLAVGEKRDDTEKKAMALVTMMHGDGAWKLVHTISKLKDQEPGFSLMAHLVPASPDILLPPIVVEEYQSQQIQSAMIKSYQECLKSGGKLPDTEDANQKSSTSKETAPASLDTQKVAAAAGGNNYDEDADPLNAAAVLQAVKEFREGLAKTSTVQQSRRIKLVQERLEKAIKQLKTSQSSNGPPAGVPPTGVAPLAPPGLPPPPSISTVDSGKRGQSNLPAWMTQQQSQAPVPPTLSEEPPQKKIKLGDDLIKVLRPFIAQQIAHYMGEEEETLIDFILKHVMEEKPIHPDLVTELQPVLEEDTNSFLQALETKLKQLGIAVTKGK